MRIRYILGIAAFAAVFASPIPAQAAVTGSSADAPAVSESAAVWQWVYAGDYPSRSACDSEANFLRDYYNIRGQCRGPYSSGRFELWIWVDR